MFLLVMVFAITLLGAGYFYLTRNFKFWTERNVKGPRPKIFYGNYKDFLYGKIHAAELAKKYYDEFSEEKFVGVFVQNSPAMILRDPELIKDVLIRDFNVFSDRGIKVDANIEPLSQNFFNMPHDSWRPIRDTLNPAFKPSKIKEMCDTMQDTADRFVRYINDTLGTSGYLECTELMAKFTTEIVGGFGFGLSMNEFSVETSLFREIRKSRLQSSLYHFFRRFLRKYAPGMYKLFHYFFHDNKLVDFYINRVREIKAYRENDQKDNYIGLLLNNNHNWSEKMIAAQAYVFFTSGSDSVSNVIGNGIFEIASNKLVQQKLREEIHHVFLERKDESFSDRIKDMRYLDAVYKETLRKHPLRNIIRTCNRRYTFKDTNVTIPPGTHIIIPLLAIQRDENIFNDPDTFSPERFIGDANNRNSAGFIPFGFGPRQCIGKLFAEYVTKMAIISLVRKFKLDVDDECLRGDNDPRRVFLAPKKGLRVKYETL